MINRIKDWFSGIHTGEVVRIEGCFGGAGNQWLYVLSNGKQHRYATWFNYADFPERGSTIRYKLNKVNSGRGYMLTELTIV